MTGRRRVRPFGDTAVVADAASAAEAHALASVLAEALGWRPGEDGPLDDVVVGYRSVTVVSDPARDAGGAALGAAAAELARLAPHGVAGGGADHAATGRTIEIPVAFDGPDLGDVARLAGASPSEVVALLTATPLPVAFLGFLPGFAYLHGLPPALAAVPRRPTPRPAVTAGALALGGGFAGVYPQASPGGWQLVGRTGTALFDPSAAPFAVLRPGDCVRLRAVDDPGAPAVTPPRDRLRAPGGAGSSVSVEDPGLLTTVQDGGRRGVAALGVPRGGAADPFALRAANRLVGNEDGAAGLEVTARGPVLRFGADTHVAVLGPAALTLDGSPVASGAVVPVAAGQVLSVGAVTGELRAWVALAGGVASEPVLGSRSSDLLTGLGLGPLRAGDVLGLGPPGRPRGRLQPAGPLSSLPAVRVVRVIPGPDGPAGGVGGAAGEGWDGDGLGALTARTWTVAPASDRMGVRLEAEAGGGDPGAIAPGDLAGGDRGRPAGGAPGVDSRAVVTGAVQVPADGRPVVLLCDHATVGGYPVPATVASADVGVVARCRPGDRLRFEVVDTETARRVRDGAERALDRCVSGWYPVRSG